MYLNLQVNKFIKDNRYLIFITLLTHILFYIFTDKNKIQIFEDHVLINLYDDKIEHMNLREIDTDRHLHISIQKTFAQSKDMIEIIKKIQKVWLGDIKKFLDAGKKVRFYYNGEYLSFLSYRSCLLFVMSHNGHWTCEAIGVQIPIQLSNTIDECNMDFRNRNHFSILYL